MTQRQFLILSAGLVLFAFAVREWHILASVLPNPTQGDISSYLNYALNMAWEGVFTKAGNGEPIVPDAYRSPGYPIFLLGVYKLTGLDGWYPAVYQAQAVVGTLTVGGVILLARQWLSYHWALVAGGLLAVWPHHIVATNAMLIEIVFGFMIVAALLLAAEGLSRRSMGWSMSAGVAFGCGYLINPVMAFFPLALLIVFWRNRESRLGIVVLLISLIVVFGWGARNSFQDAQGDDRAWQNLVQGSWPEFHHVETRWSSIGEESAALDEINSEIDTILISHEAGLQRIAARLGEDPGRYAQWYLMHKPYLLWDWDIRIGRGGIYTVETLNSPVERGRFRYATRLLEVLNPILFFLAIGFALIGWKQGGPASMAVLFFVYVTAVHTVFQAEPRYAVAYRPVEMLLIASALARMWAFFCAFRRDVRN
jgi:hypothetical protein